MRRLAILFLLVSTLTASAQWLRPAREIRTETNGWTYIPTTKTNAQLVFDWLDAELFQLSLDGSSWTNLPATNNLQAVLDWVDLRWPNYASQIRVTTNGWGNGLVGAFTNVQDVLDYLDNTIRTNALTNIVFALSGSTNWSWSMTNDTGYLGYPQTVVTKMGLRAVYSGTGYGDATGGSAYTNRQDLRFSTTAVDTNYINIGTNINYWGSFTPTVDADTWSITLALNYACTNGTPAAVGTPVAVVLVKTPKAGGASTFWVDQRTVPVGYLGRLDLSYITVVETSATYSAYIDWGGTATYQIPSLGFYIHSLVPE